MNDSRLMSLEEVEQCDYAYLLYQKDDPEVHCFLRMHTYDDFISFTRPLDKKDNIRCQPHLWKEYYGKEWFAYTNKPSAWQISLHKKGMSSCD